MSLWIIPELSQKGTHTPFPEGFDYKIPLQKVDHTVLLNSANDANQMSQGTTSFSQ